jgi:predicted ArsR family transcriptional regulator
MAQLVQLMAEQDSQNGFTSGTTEELLAAAVPIRPCVERLLASGAVTMVASEGGVGKSVLIYRLAEAVANGGKFGGELQAVKGNVLVIQRDESASNAAQKLRLMGMSAPEGSIQWEFQWNGAMYPELRKWIHERQVRLVVMDSFGSLFAGAGAGMGEAEVGLHLYRLNQIASEEDCAIVLTHHLRKQGKEKAGERKDVFLGDLFGSSYIVNGASDVWGVIKDSESAEPKFKLKVLKPRSGITEAGDTFELLGSREDLSLTLAAHNGDAEGVEKARGQALQVLQALSGRTEETALDIQEIAGAINGHPVAVGRVLKALVGDKHPGLQRVPLKTGKRGRPQYRYWVEG